MTAKNTVEIYGVTHLASFLAQLTREGIAFTVERKGEYYLVTLTGF